jgi:hypothetical protein
MKSTFGRDLKNMTHCRISIKNGQENRGFLPLQNRLFIQNENNLTEIPS